MFLAGSVFFVGGILSSLVVSREINWFLFIPYIRGFTQAMFLELSFLPVGISLSVAGITTGLYYYRTRNWYLKQLSKAKDAEYIIRPLQMVISRPSDTPKTRAPQKGQKQTS